MMVNNYRIHQNVDGSNLSVGAPGKFNIGRWIVNIFPKRKGSSSKHHLGISKSSGKTPKMDGENKGKPY